MHSMCKLNILKCDTTHINRMLCLYSTLLCSPRVELDMQQLFPAGYRCDSAVAADNQGILSIMMIIRIRILSKHNLQSDSGHNESVIVSY